MLIHTKQNLMKDQELAQRLMATFLEELHMHVSTIGRELLALEKNPTAGERAECWKTICRAVHTLKGASAVVNIEGIRSACHSLEDIFGGYRDSQRDLSEEMTSTLLKAIDAIEETGMRLRAEQDLEDSPLNKLLPELQRLAAVELSGGSANDHSSTQEPARRKPNANNSVQPQPPAKNASPPCAAVGSNEPSGRDAGANRVDPRPRAKTRCVVVAQRRVARDTRAIRVSSP